jgi:hypothetical protein
VKGVLAHTEDSDWRKRVEFKKMLWIFRENRMAVYFEYQCHAIQLLEPSPLTAADESNLGSGSLNLDFPKIEV